MNHGQAPGDNRMLLLDHDKDVACLVVKAQQVIILVVKALQGLGVLDVSMVLWVQGSVIQWFKDSDEDASPNWTEDERETMNCKI